VTDKLQCIPEQELAIVNQRTIKVFDRVQVFIKAEMVEFRRSVSLVY
jgi:hypothetical protein